MGSQRQTTRTVKCPVEEKKRSPILAPIAREVTTEVTMMGVMPTLTPAAVATTTLAVDMDSMTGLRYAEKNIFNVFRKFNFSGKSGSQASGGQGYTTSYNYNKNTSSTKYQAPSNK